MSHETTPLTPGQMAQLACVLEATARKPGSSSATVDTSGHCGARASEVTAIALRVPAATCWT